MIWVSLAVTRSASQLSLAPITGARRLRSAGSLSAT